VNIRTELWEADLTESGWCYIDLHHRIPIELTIETTILNAGRFPQSLGKLVDLKSAKFSTMDGKPIELNTKYIPSRLNLAIFKQGVDDRKFMMYFNYMSEKEHKAIENDYIESLKHDERPPPQWYTGC